jgi:hypothetical protein
MTDIGIPTKGTTFYKTVQLLAFADEIGITGKETRSSTKYCSGCNGIKSKPRKS